MAGLPRLQAAEVSHGATQSSALFKGEMFATLATTMNVPVRF